jgi:hypothetical protein
MPDPDPDRIDPLDVALAAATVALFAVVPLLLILEIVRLLRMEN